MPQTTPRRHLPLTNQRRHPAPQPPCSQALHHHRQAAPSFETFCRHRWANGPTLRAQPRQWPRRAEQQQEARGTPRRRVKRRSRRTARRATTRITRTTRIAATTTIERINALPSPARLRYFASFFPLRFTLHLCSLVTTLHFHLSSRFQTISDSLRHSFSSSTLYFHAISCVLCSVHSSAGHCSSSPSRNCLIFHNW